jgi:exopolysaccharide biosynthesis polyprenyl glycosylphosphotransferase
MKLVFPAGSLALVGFFMVVHGWVIASPTYDPFGTSRLPWTALFAASFLVTAYGVGLPDLPRSRAAALGMALVALLGGLAAVSFLQLGLGAALLPRAVIAGSSLTLVPWSMLCWHLQNDVAAGGTARVLVVGTADDRAALEAELIGTSDSAALVVGHVTVEVAEGEPDSLVAAAERSGADVLVLNLAAQASVSVVSQAAELHQQGIRIRTASLFSEEYLGKIPVADLERVSLLFDIGEVHRVRYVRAKRIVDLTVGLLALPVLAILIPVIGAANRFGNRGPLFYSQVRIGKFGRPFVMLKFRSMRVSDGPTSWTMSGDDRITGVGRFLRRSHLDELPQIWNVLKGDLSIVGPRPEQSGYVEELRVKIPYYDVRHLVRPGLTGWAQVKYGYASDTDDAREKLQYDLYYLRRQSVAMDLAIIVRTLRAVIRGDGR